MEDIKFYKLLPLDNMMCNIREEGKRNVLKEIETIKDAVKRFRKRELFNYAVKKLF